MKKLCAIDSSRDILETETLIGVGGGGGGGNVANKS